MDNFIDKLAQKFTAGEVIRANTAAEERELKRLREQVAEYEKCLQEMRKVQMTNTQTAQNLHDFMVESAENLRKLTAESTEIMRRLTEESTETIQKLTEESTGTMQRLTAENTEALQKFTAESNETFQKFTEESTENFHKLTEESAETLQKLTTESMAKITDIQLETDDQKAEARKSLETAAMTMEQMESKVVKMQETVAELTAALEKNQKEVAEWFKQADDFLHKENVKVYRNVQAVVVEEVGNKAESIMKAQEETAKKSGKPVLILAAVGAVAAAANLVIQILGVVGMFK